jgi:hypothetical protein
MKQPRPGAASSLGGGMLLAVRADAEKFKLMRHGLEAVCRRNPLLDLGWKTFHDLHNFRATRANQMMVMAVVVFADQFKPGRAIAKIKTLDHAHFFQQMHRTINCREVALVFGQSGQNFLIGQRVRMPPQNLQDRGARAGDFMRLPA